MSNIIGITKTGKEVALDAPGVAYQLDKDDGNFAKDLELLQAKLAKEDGFSILSDESKAGTPGTFHQSVDGVAVPLTIADTKTPEQVLDKLRAENKIETDSTGNQTVRSSPAKK